MPKSMSVQIKRDGLYQPLLFRVIDGACGVHKAAGPSVPDFKEDQRFAIPADQIYLTAAVVDVTFKNPDAATGKVASRNVFEMISQGFCAIHGD